MAVIVEGLHAGEFLVSEGNGAISREAGILKMGQKVVDGTVLQLNGGKLIKVVADLDTDGNLEVPVEGIVIGNWDASATGTNADIKNVPYIKRLAEVKDALLTYPAETTEGGEKAAVKASLAEKFIIPR